MHLSFLQTSQIIIHVKMNAKFYHGNLNAGDIAKALLARFNSGNLVAQQIKNQKQTIVQIATRQRPISGGQTAMGVVLQQNEDGVTVHLGKQAWMGIAASLGVTALAALRNPMSLLGRLDDLAQDIENLQLDDQIWETIEDVARAAGASQQLSDKLRSLVCEYCRVANPLGEANCLACGAPLGDIQPITCDNCGFVVSATQNTCPNCNNPL